MTTQEQDTFVRSNVSSSWGTASNGASWSHAQGTSTISLTSNQGHIVSTPAAWDIMLIDSSTTYTDSDISCRIASTTSNIDTVGIALRATSNASTCYLLVYDGSAGTKGAYIYYAHGGSLTTVASNTTISFTFGNEYQFRAVAIGTALFLKIWADGTAEPAAWTIQTTDSNISSGRQGVIGNANGSGDCKYDQYFSVDYYLADTALTPSDSIAAVEALSNTDSLSGPAETLLSTEAYTGPHENVSSNNSMSVTINQTITDTLSEVETLSNVLVYTSTDSLSGLVEVLLNTEVFNGPHESVTSNNSMSSTVIQLNEDDLSTTDTFSFVFTALLTDTLNFIELLSVAFNITFAVEQLTVQDVPTFNPIMGANLYDFLLITDSITSASLMFDTLTIIDSQIMNVVVNLADTALTLSDTISGLKTVLFGFNDVPLAVQEGLSEIVSYSATDSVSASDSGETTVSQSFSDQLTSSENSSYVLLSQLMDTLLTSDSVALAFQITLVADQLNLNDSITPTGIILNTDQLTQSEVNLLTLTVNNPADHLTITEAFSTALFLSLTDTLTLTEALSALLSSVFLVDQVNIVEFLVLTLAYSTQDALAVVESYISMVVARSSPVPLSVAETVASVEVMLNTDTFIVSETVAEAVAYGSTDTLSQLETFLVVVQQATMDSVVEVESANYVVSMSVSDALTSPTESMRLSLTAALVDTSALSEVLQFSLTASFSDTLTSSDTFSGAIAAAFVDILLQQEIYTSTVKSSGSDQLNVNEAVVVSTLYQVAETVQVTEQPVYVIVYLPADVLSIQDLSSLAISQRLYFMAGTDQLSVTDTPIYVVTYMAPSDVITPSDALSNSEYHYAYGVGQVRSGKVAGSIRSGQVTGVVRGEQVAGTVH